MVNIISRPYCPCIYKKSIVREYTVNIMLPNINKQKTMSADVIKPEHSNIYRYLIFYRRYFLTS
jgi:hypothetical protein